MGEALLLHLSSAQIAQLGQKNRDRFVSLLVEYINTHFPEYALETPSHSVREWVDAAVTKADGYGVTTEPECAQLVLLLLPLGLDADERHAWVRETLTDPDLIAIGKIRKLAELAREHEIDDVDDVVVYDFME